MKPKVLFVSTLLPTKLGGMRSLYYNIVSFLKAGCEVHLVLVKAGPVEKRVLFGLPKKVKFASFECDAGGIDPLCLLFPLQHKEMSRIGGALEKVQGYIDGNGIDAVITHSIDATFALRNLRCKVKSGYQLDSFARYYRTKWEFSPSPQVLLFGSLQSMTFGIAQRELFRKYGLLAYVSSSDAPRGRPWQEKVFVISQGRDPPSKNKNLGPRPYDVVIFGRFEHPPNRDGLQRIMERLGDIDGNVHIIGPNLSLAKTPAKNVKVHGMVKDIEEYLSRAKLCLLPVWYGAGLQTKVFDAMRNGCMVVTTRFTKQAFESDGMHSESILVSDDLVAKANAVLASYSPMMAKGPYQGYERFYRLNVRKEKEYVQKILEMCANEKQVAGR